jgi:hypothetical protein
VKWREWLAKAQHQLTAWFLRLWVLAQHHRRLALLAASFYLPARRRCPCQQDALVEAWIRALALPTEPRRYRDPKAQIIHEAALYEELERTEGWRDFLRRMEAFQAELRRTLLYGTFTTREPGVDDAQIRAMLFMLGRALSIPAEIKIRYEQWRKTDDEMRRAGLAGTDPFDALP